MLNKYLPDMSKPIYSQSQIQKEQEKDGFPTVKIRKEEFQKAFNVSNKSYFSNFEMG